MDTKKWLAMAVVLVAASVHGQVPTTCSILTQISPYILAYTMVDYEGAQSVCAGFGANLAQYEPAMNTEFGLWTEICNFYYNSVGQTVTTPGYTPPFWVDGTSVTDATTTLCAVLPYGIGQATVSTTERSFANCGLQFYPLCQQPIATSTVDVATDIITIPSTVNTITTSTTRTIFVNSSVTSVVLSTISTTVTDQSVSTITTLSATTSFVTDLTTLTGNTTITRTRTVSSVLTDQIVKSTTTTSTTTIPRTTSTQSTTTTTTLRTLFTCID